MKKHVPENINLIIVDDSIDNLDLLSMTLEQEGLTIFTTTSPRNALSICKENEVSIALVDVKMPEMDGNELLDIIKKNPLTEHILVVLITGYSMRSEDIVEGINNGAVDYLFKPLDLYVTLAKVNSLIVSVKHDREIKKQNRELEIYQQKLYKAIEEKEKVKVNKENFLANMSHELRSPLNGIIGLLALLSDSIIDPEQLEIIGLMEYSSKSLIGVVNDILESAQLDAGKIFIKRTNTDIVKLVHSICVLALPLAKEKGLNLICEIDPDTPSILLADGLRLSQILINLVNNSVKFTHIGSVHLKVKVLNINEDNATLQFVIEDTGIGIPESHIGNIFNRFEQVEDRSFQKFGGTGLGLSIVKRLVDLKGGTLSVESEVGVGTKFVFTNLFDQVKTQSNHQSVSAKISSLPKFDNIQVLLADDNLTSQYVILKMLKEWNIRVEIATNGLEAFEKLNSDDFDLVLMDTHMPVMDGLEATLKIRESSSSKKHIPIISFSASVMEAEKENAIKAGVDDFIEKPFEPEVLNNKIRRLLQDKKYQKSFV